MNLIKSEFTITVLRFNLVKWIIGGWLAPHDLLRVDIVNQPRMDEFHWALKRVIGLGR